MGGHDVDVSTAVKGALNVLVTSKLGVAEVGASGENGASGRLQGNAVSFIGLGGAPHWILSHELAHQFLGDTTRSASFLTNFTRDLYINRDVLPNITAHSSEVRKGAQDFAGP